MVDSIRIKEIHQTLDAGIYAAMPHNVGLKRVANLGYYIERIARVLGISVEPDGNIRSIRQSKWIQQGKTIPAGWSLGQWGFNYGGSETGQPGGLASEERDGLAYDIRSNRMVIDEKTGKATQIEEGGYVLVENFPQLLAYMMADLDRGLGLQAAGANVIPEASGTDVFTYQGMHSLLIEIAYTLSHISKAASQTQVSSLINQATLYEILGALGLPIDIKQIKVALSENSEGTIPYPALAEDSPTVLNVLVWILSNLAPLLASQLAVTKTPETKEKPKDARAPII